jgi:hypothetical protein
MAFVSIQGIWTWSSDVWTPENSFRWNDPFGVSLHINCSSDLTTVGARYDIQWQLVNPREDWFGRTWFRFQSGVQTSPTVDVLFEDQQFQATNFVHWISWGRYSDVMGAIGGGIFAGVFAVRGHIQVLGTDLFDMTDPYGFKYQLRKDDGAG